MLKPPKTPGASAPNLGAPARCSAASPRPNASSSRARAPPSAVTHSSARKSEPTASTAGTGGAPSAAAIHAKAAASAAKLPGAASADVLTNTTRPSVSCARNASLRSPPLTGVSDTTAKGSFIAALRQRGRRAVRGRPPRRCRAPSRSRRRRRSRDRAPRAHRSRPTRGRTRAAAGSSPAGTGQRRQCQQLALVGAVGRQHEVEVVEVLGADLAGDAGQRHPTRSGGGDRPRVGALADVPGSGPSAVDIDLRRQPRAASISWSTPSAVGERQMLPMQTKRTLTTATMMTPPAES